MTVSGSYLYVTTWANGSSGSGTICKYDAATGAPVDVPLVSGLTGPNGIVVSGSNLFVVNETAGTIGEYTTSGATVNATLISGLATGSGRYPVGIAVSGSNLFVTKCYSGVGQDAIAEYDATTGALVNPSLISGLSNPFGIAVSGTDLFVANDAAGTIGEYTTSGVTVNASLISGLGVLSPNPARVAVFGSDLFVTMDTPDEIDEYDMSGNLVEAPLISGLCWPANVVVTATPEPSTFVLLGIGAISLLAYAWRRRR